MKRITYPDVKVMAAEAETAAQIAESLERIAKSRAALARSTPTGVARYNQATRPTPFQPWPAAPLRVRPS